VEQAGELEELGLDEALYDGVLLIEWPERLPALWPSTLRLTLKEAPAGGAA
jgi:tRNA threonylcarbamoyladenosine biosynthesis protein TsaE